MILALGDVRVAVGLRVGMAQDLAVAGFSLPQIMRAARWTDPKMPAIYIRNLKRRSLRWQGYMSCGRLVVTV